MKNNKINTVELGKIVQEQTEAMSRVEEMNLQLEKVNSLLERFDNGEEISEEELNELVGGLGAVGKWSSARVRDALGAAGKAVGKAVGGAGKALNKAAGDVKKQYDMGQRAHAINKQKIAKDKEQEENNQKVQNLVQKGKQLKGVIKKCEDTLVRVAKEYERLTGKEYVPGRAVANAKRYV